VTASAARCFVVADAHLGQVPPAIQVAFHAFLDQVPHPGDQLLINGTCSPFSTPRSSATPRIAMKPATWSDAARRDLGESRSLGRLLRRDLGIQYYWANPLSWPGARSSCTVTGSPSSIGVAR
jgi:hypothetical protein